MNVFVENPAGKWPLEEEKLDVSRIIILKLIEYI
jgi:hypothetical protein